MGEVQDVNGLGANGRRLSGDLNFGAVSDTETAPIKVTAEGEQLVQLTGSKVEEQLTEADAVTGTLTFAQNIEFIGIYNRDTVNDGVFNVNGIDLTIPKGEPADFRVGGTPRATVTVTGSTSYIVTRYV